MPPSDAQLNAQLQAIRIKQQQIENAIKVVRERLKQAERDPGLAIVLMDGRLPENQGLDRPMTLEELLRQRLRELQAMLKQQPREAAAIRFAIAQQMATQAQGDFQAKVKSVLKKSEKRGSLDEADQRQLNQDAAGVLNRLIVVLKAEPSPKNAGATVQHLMHMMQIGADSQACEPGFLALKEAGGKMEKQADNAFRRNPTPGNYQRLLDMRRLNQTFGGNAKELPERWRPVKGKHTVERGESLSSISQKYYNSPAYWDKIYEENLAIKDPNQLPAGLPLTIP